MKPTILLVDDDAELLFSLKMALDMHYAVELVRRGARALKKAAQTNYNCILLDVGLPDISGLEVCKRLRETGNTVPVVIMSGDNDPGHKAELLDAGADDYVTKPVDMIELEARLRTAIRRTRPTRSLASQLSINGVTIDSVNHTVERSGVAIQLRPKEFTLLECLMNNADRVVSRPALLQYGWDDRADVWPSVVDVHIKYLRDKLDYPFERPLIKTVHGIGYKFDASRVAHITKRGKGDERAITNHTH